jgi:integrase
MRFGRLKTRLGYGPGLVFHSIRKTVSTLFEDAQVPEGVTADIRGHEKNTITYGLYSRGPSMQTKRETLERAVRYEAQHR